MLAEKIFNVAHFADQVVFMAFGGSKCGQCWYYFRSFYCSW